MCSVLSCFHLYDSFATRSVISVSGHISVVRQSLYIITLYSNCSCKSCSMLVCSFCALVLIIQIFALPLKHGGSSILVQSPVFLFLYLVCHVCFVSIILFLWIEVSHLFLCSLICSFFAFFWVLILWLWFIFIVVGGNLRFFCFLGVDYSHSCFFLSSLLVAILMTSSSSYTSMLLIIMSVIADMAISL